MLLVRNRKSVAVKQDHNGALLETAGRSASRGAEAVRLVSSPCGWSRSRPVFNLLTIPAAATLNAVASRARAVAAAGSRSVVPLTYGEDRLGALILNVLPAGASSSTLLVQCLWGFACDDISAVRLNDQALPTGSTVTHYTGAQTTVDSALAAAFTAQGLTYADTLEGYAYTVVAMPTLEFTGQLNITALVRGRVVYDPRHDQHPYKDTSAAVAGSPGTPPTGWFFSNSNGISVAVVGSGAEGGIQYLDVRLSGTATAVAGPRVWTTNYASVAASSGQTWKGAVRLRLVDGSTSGITSIYAFLAARDVSNVATGTAISGTGPTSLPIDQPLANDRRVTGTATATAGTTQVTFWVHADIPITSVVDCTLRIGFPELWETTDVADVEAWSENPALALGDFLHNAEYGLGRLVDWASVEDSADHCDALIGSPAETRRVVGVSFVQPASAVDMAEALRAYAGCFIVGDGMNVALLPDEDVATSASYVHADGDIAALTGLVKRDTGNQPTAVEVLYTDTSQIPWREASATAEAPGAGTTRPWRLSQVRLPGIQRHSQAYREAVERLNKLTLSDLSCVLEVFDEGIQHQVGDIVEVTHPLGLVAKAMRVGAVEMPGHGRWRLALAEHDAAAYSTDVVTASSTADTGFINPAGPPAAVASLAGFASGRRIACSAYRIAS